MPSPQRLLIVLACLVASSLTSPARAKIPEWFVAGMAKSTAGSGRWITDNGDYQSPTEPYDAYGIEWRYGLGKQSLVGRLFGLVDGEEAGTFWEMRTFWHPGEERVVLHQYGADGRVGIGPLALLDDGREESVQVFHVPDGTSSRVRHLSWYEEDGTHITISFNEKQGEWVENRSYAWELEE